MALELTEEQKKAGWQVKQLGELCISIQSGGTPNRKEPSYYSSSVDGIPWAKTQEIRDGKIYDTEEFISYAGLENSSAKIVPDNTILIAMYGATVGRIGLSAKSMATNQAACALLVDEKKASFLYLYYHLFSVRETLIGLANGAAQQNLNLRTIKEFEVALPPLDEQKRIAKILGSVDDKIEANSRLVETLTELVDARVAEARAQGAESVKISDLAVQSRNQLLPSKATAGLVLHYSLPAFDAGTVPAVEEAGSIRSSKFVVSRPAVLFSKLNPGTPRIWMVEPDSEKYNFASTEFVVLEPRDGVSLGTLWAACRDPRVSQKLSEFARGTSSSHQRVSPKDILDSSVVVPEIVEEETTLIRRLTSENVSLAETRNLLICQLIGKEIVH